MVGKRGVLVSNGRTNGSGSGTPHPGTGGATFLHWRRGSAAAAKKRHARGSADLERGLLPPSTTSLSHPSHSSNGQPPNRHTPLSTSSRPRPRPFRFQDAAASATKLALEDARREDLKRALLHNDGIDHTGLEKYRKSEAELRGIKSRAVREFYSRQNDRLNDWLEVDAVVMALADDVLESMDPDPDHDGDMERRGGLQHVRGNIRELLPEEERGRRAKEGRRARWAININVVANVLLLAGKIAAVLSTGSLSLVASLVDSALDLLCTLIVWSTNRLVQWRLDALQKRFPVGRRRLEPLGILVFSIIMVISFLQILEESVQKLIPLQGEPQMLSPTAIAALLATVAVKGAIGIACLGVKTTQVRALVQDCKTDVVFNTLSLLFPFVGQKAHVWWLDPAGAGILSLFIIIDWSQTCLENISRLSGEAASPGLQQKLLYLAWRFAPVPVVEGIKSVRAYHAGDGVWAEFDLLLAEGAPLRTCHDLAETLQYCAEGLDMVDRAFVTTDYSSFGPSGHAAV